MKKAKRRAKIVSLLESGEKKTVSQIAALLAVDVDRKTIQRDLKSLMQAKKVSQSGAGRGTVYYVSDYNKVFQRVDTDAYFAKDFQKRNIKERFDFDIFTILADDIFTDGERERIEELHRQFVKNISQYKSQTLINKEYERIMIEFSWKSSAIEGNTYTLLATEALLKENIAGEGKTREETQMILNHKDAFNEAIQNRERFVKLDYRDIEYLHAVLTKDLGIARNIRNNAVGITGTKYKPLDNAHQIREALEKTVKLINKKQNFFEKAFLALILLSYIQAFEDGNKRIARMLSNAILLAFNSIPLSYRAVEVEEYKKAMILFYEQNNISSLKEIFIEQFADAVENYFQ